MLNYILLAPVFFPIIIALSIIILKSNSFKRNLIISIGVILNFIIILAIYNISGDIKVHIFKFNEFIDIYFNLDKLSITFSFLVSSLWIFTTFYSIEYMNHEHNQNRFFTFFIATLGITIGIAFSGNLATLYIFYELLTLCTFPLVIHEGSKKALKSGYKYLGYSFFGATFVLLGMVLLFTKTQNLEFITSGIITNIPKSDSTYYLISYLLMFIGFGVKAAIVPFHSWLPSAMVAPTPVSSLLHAVAVVKSGIFALIRITYFVFGPYAIMQTKGDKFVIVFIFLTILMGSFLAMHQQNLKKRLAYSTISQLGYIMIGLVIFNTNAFIGGILHMIFHALIKITLFFCVGAIIHTTGKTEINEIHGIGKKMPKLMWCFSIASISLIGIPPTNGFVSKWYLAIGGLQNNSILVPVVLLLSALLTALYLIPIISTAFFKTSTTENITIKEPPIFMLAPIIILTITIVILGFYPNPLIKILREISIYIN